LLFPTAGVTQRPQLAGGNAVRQGKLKTWLRTAQARPREQLAAAIKTAAKWLPEQDAKN